MNKKALSAAIAAAFLASVGSASMAHDFDPGPAYQGQKRERIDFKTTDVISTGTFVVKSATQITNYDAQEMAAYIEGDLTITLQGQNIRAKFMEVTCDMPAGLTEDQKKHVYYIAGMAGVQFLIPQPDGTQRTELRELHLQVKRNNSCHMDYIPAP